MNLDEKTYRITQIEKVHIPKPRTQHQRCD